MNSQMLGDLEKEVMEIVWQVDRPIAVKEVLDTIKKKRIIAYTTVMTIMSRLANKGILTRKLQGSSYLYKPKIDREKFIAKSAERIFSSAVSAFGEEVATYFAKEIQKLNPRKKAELLSLLDDETSKT